MRLPGAVRWVAISGTGAAFSTRIVFAERFTQGWAPDPGRMRPWAWRPAPGGHWLRLERDRGGKNGVVCLGANGKEAWYVPGVENWRRRYQALGVG